MLDRVMEARSTLLVVLIVLILILLIETQETLETTCGKSHGPQRLLSLLLWRWVSLHYTEVIH